MSLTVKEKEHWRERINQLVDKRVESLIAANDPTLMQRVAEKAHKQAYVSLGIDAQQEEIEAIEERKKELEKRQVRLQAEQRAAINGTTLEEELERSSFYSTRADDIRHAVNSRADVLMDNILGTSTLGKQVIALRAEKDRMLDTVWLATSGKQIKDLWAEVNVLLEREPTELEGKALAMSPIETEGE